MKLSYLIITLIYILGSEFSLAQTSANAPMISSGMTADEIALRAKARRKMYPGGMDEEPLKVQAQLPQLKSKFVAEEDAPPPTDEVD